MRILIVDDNRLLTTILADHLVARGHTVIPAFDGRMAEVFCDRDRFDLLVIDMVLPQLDGIDLLERLRSKQSPAQVIVVTGFPELAQGESGRLAALDVAAVLHKPFSFSDVDDVMERLTQ
jgi:DNA-binding response OmpR family regulator